MIRRASLGIVLGLIAFTALAVSGPGTTAATPGGAAAKTKEMAEFKEMYRNPLVNIAYTSLEPLPVGILFTLIAAGVLSRKRREEGTAAA